MPCQVRSEGQWQPGDTLDPLLVEGNDLLELAEPEGALGNPWRSLHSFRRLQVLPDGLLWVEVQVPLGTPVGLVGSLQPNCQEERFPVIGPGRQELPGILPDPDIRMCAVRRGQFQRARFQSASDARTTRGFREQRSSDTQYRSSRNGRHVGSGYG